MDFTKQDHIRQLRDSLRRFVEKEMPRTKAAEWDKDNHFPRDVFQKLARLGVMGLTVPEHYTQRYDGPQLEDNWAYIKSVRRTRQLSGGSPGPARCNDQSPRLEAGGCYSRQAGGCGQIRLGFVIAGIKTTNQGDINECIHRCRR
jgi:alkylation response protein AidB-like acyl-CoA dehydrogenase